MTLIIYQYANKTLIKWSQISILICYTSQQLRLFTQPWENTSGEIMDQITRKYTELPFETVSCSTSLLLALGMWYGTVRYLVPRAS